VRFRHGPAGQYDCMQLHILLVSCYNSSSPAGRFVRSSNAIRGFNIVGGQYGVGFGEQCPLPIKKISF